MNPKKVNYMMLCALSVFFPARWIFIAYAPFTDKIEFLGYAAILCLLLIIKIINDQIK